MNTLIGKSPGSDVQKQPFEVKDKINDHNH